MNVLVETTQWISTTFVKINTFSVLYCNMNLLCHLKYEGYIALHIRLS